VFNEHRCTRLDANNDQPPRCDEYANAPPNAKGEGESANVKFHQTSPFLGQKVTRKLTAEMTHDLDIHQGHP
jgi:hypothetical protein